MVTFGEITTKNLRVNYTKDDIEGYIVSGSVAYNKDNVLIDANGNIKNAEGTNIGNFTIYGERSRINLNDCLTEFMVDAIAIAEATLADLASSYPEE